MAKRKFQIVDQNGENIGFVVIDIAAPRFEHVSQTFLPSEGPVHDAMLFTVVLGGFTAVPWLFGAPGWIAATTGVTLTATLAGIKAWRGSLPEPEKPGGPGPEVTIKLEQWNDDGQILLDQVRDKSIDLEDWRKVAQAVVYYNVNFSRPALSRYVSQTTYHKIKTEFVRLRYAYRKGNNYILTPRVMAFLRKIHNLPY